MGDSNEYGCMTSKIPKWIFIKKTELLQYLGIHIKKRFLFRFIIVLTIENTWSIVRGENHTDSSSHTKAKANHSKAVLPFTCLTESEGLEVGSMK